MNSLRIAGLLLLTAGWLFTPTAEASSTSRPGVWVRWDNNKAMAAAEHFYVDPQRKSVYLLQLGPNVHPVKDCLLEEINAAILLPDNRPERILVENINNTNLPYHALKMGPALSCAKDNYGELDRLETPYYLGAGQATYLASGHPEEYYAFDANSTCPDSVAETLFKVHSRASTGAGIDGMPPLPNKTVNVSCTQPRTWTRGEHRLYWDLDYTVPGGVFVVLAYLGDNRPVGFVPIVRLGGEGITEAGLDKLKATFAIRGDVAPLSAMAELLPKNLTVDQVFAREGRVFFDVCPDYDAPSSTCPEQRRHFRYPGGDNGGKAVPANAQRTVSRSGEDVLLYDAAIELDTCEPFVSKGLGLKVANSAMTERAWISDQNQELQRAQRGESEEREQFVCRGSALPVCELPIGSAQGTLLGASFEQGELKNVMRELVRTCGEDSELRVVLHSDVVMEKTRRGALSLGRFQHVTLTSIAGARYRLTVQQSCSWENKCNVALGSEHRTLFAADASYGAVRRLSLVDVDITFKPVPDEAAQELDASAEVEAEPVANDADRKWFNLKVTLFHVAGTGSQKTRVILRNAGLGDLAGEDGYVGRALFGERLRVFAQDSTFAVRTTYAPSLATVHLADSLAFLGGTDPSHPGSIRGTDRALRLLGGQSSVLLYGQALEGGMDTDVNTQGIVLDCSWKTGMGERGTPLRVFASENPNSPESYNVFFVGDTKIQDVVVSREHALVSFWGSPAHIWFAETVGFFNAMGEAMKAKELLQVTLCSGEGDMLFWNRDPSLGAACRPVGQVQ